MVKTSFVFFKARLVKAVRVATAAPATKTREATSAAAASPVSPAVCANRSWGCDCASRIPAETTAFAWR